MASTGATLFAFWLICACVVWSVSATLEDGRPRPRNFPDAPTVTYDNTPVLVDSNGLPVDCTWYGFANELYDAATGASCLAVVRKALTNATVNHPSNMQPYVYYTIRRLIDPVNNNSYCFQGCFNLGNSSAPPPGAGAPPPQLEAAAPSPLDAAPPPLTFGVPPSSFSPAPSVYPGAPPPSDASTPPLGDVPPASIDAPPASSPAPGVGGPSVGNVVAPSAPPTSLPNTGPFLQPATLFSFLVTAVTLAVNLAA